MYEQLVASLSPDNPISAMQPLVTGTGHALGVLGAVIGTTSYLAMTALLLPIYFFFFTWRFEAIALTVKRLIPATHRPRVLDILGKIDQAVLNFFRGRLVIALVTGVLYAAGWAWTGVPYWFLLGAGTGLLSIIPYVNAIGWPLAIILKYLDAVSASGPMDWFTIILLPSLPYLIVQFFESWWLTPWIEGRSNDLHPVTVIIAVMVGGAAGGFLGLTLAIPIAAAGKILLYELVLPRWKRWIQGP
jgi:predicted PurR-regulated permease PerM